VRRVSLSFRVVCIIVGLQGLMYTAQAIGTSFDYVQVVDLASIAKLQDPRSSVLSVVQDQLVRATVSAAPSMPIICNCTFTERNAKHAIRCQGG